MVYEFQLQKTITKLSDSVSKDQNNTRTKMNNGHLVDNFFELFEGITQMYGLNDKIDRYYSCEKSGRSNKEMGKHQYTG